jgi:hypothetical protein
VIRPSRPIRFDLDYAAWHIHLAARGTPSPFVAMQRERANHASVAPVPASRVVSLDVPTWRGRLAGSTRLAA